VSRSGADAVVVGAGVIGASVALELARDGLRVVVVDRASGPGQGSTSASSAIVRFNYSTFDGVAASWESRHCWERWSAHLGDGWGSGALARFHRVGLAMLDVDLAPVARQTELFDRCQIPWEYWDPAVLAARLPGISADRCWPPRSLHDPLFGSSSGLLGALWTPDAGYVDDPALAAVNLAETARRQGVELLFGRAVVGVDDGVTLTDGTVVQAPVVVNAAGPWSPALNRLAGVGEGWTVSTRPLRQEVHQVPSTPVDVVVADLDLGTYARPTPGGALLLGGTEPECDELHWLDDPDSCSPHPTSAVWDAQTTRVARRFPSMGVPSSPTGLAGVYDVTEDWTPIYDRTEREGFFVAIGTSGNQFKNAPVAGRFLAALVRGETSYTGEHTGLTIDLTSFSRLRPRNSESTGTVMG
jgi:sarcosine oxidase subunit beta